MSFLFFKVNLNYLSVIVDGVISIGDFEVFNEK